MAQVTTDLPYDFTTGKIRYDLNEPLSALQTMLNNEKVDIESLDDRGGVHHEDEELDEITTIVENNPQQRITSSGVRDLNDRFDKTLINSDPNWIFRSDLHSRNSIDLIRTGNAAFARDRDLLTIPPPIDTQAKIYELLSGAK